MLKKVGVIMLVLLCTGAGFAVGHQVIPDKGPPGAAYSAAIRVNDTLYISGAAGEDANGNIPAEFEKEVQQTLDNIATVLTKAGMSPANVVSVQVYLTDLADFPRMNAVYTAFFKEPRPTRTTIVVARLVGGGHIEITATARL